MSIWTQTFGQQARYITAEGLYSPIMVRVRLTPAAGSTFRVRIFHNYQGGQRTFYLGGTHTPVDLTELTEDTFAGVVREIRADRIDGAGTAVLEIEEIADWQGSLIGDQGPPGTPAEEDVQYATQLDDVGGGVSYVGQAEPGSSVAAAVWRIKRITETGPDIAVVFADGNENFDNVWNNRLALSYS